MVRDRFLLTGLMLEIKNMKLIHRFRLWMCWKRSGGDIGQFYGNVGHDIARGLLPRGALDNEQDRC